jgi:hypothetical protein
MLRMRSYLIRSQLTGALGRDDSLYLTIVPRTSIGTFRFRLANRLSSDRTLILEPWATEYPFPPGKTYEIVGTGDLNAPFEIEWYDDRVVVYSIDTEGAMMTVFDDGLALP